MLLDALGFEPESLETVATHSGCRGEVIASMLLIPEPAGGSAPHSSAITTESTRTDCCIQ